MRIRSTGDAFASLPSYVAIQIGRICPIGEFGDILVLVQHRDGLYHQLILKIVC